jgi:hypothetical protein
LLTTQSGSTMQVQQPAPFVPNQPAPNAAWPGSQGQPAPTAATTSPSEPVPTGRRRRRTAAEMAQAAPQGANGTAPTAAPQAPFPHPQGTTAFVANAPSEQAKQGSFGIAQGQPATANPELAGMLNNFFKQGWG